jgi:serine/threonine protein phosphatase PrpC
MRFFSKRSRPRIDERALLGSGSSSIERPVALDGRAAVPWENQPEQQSRLMEGLAFYAEHQIPLRAEPIATPVLIPAIEASLVVAGTGLVVLTHMHHHERTELTVRRLLDSNVLLARFLGFTRSWQCSPPHTWTDWDRAVAWSEERADPHGGLFDPPATWRDMRLPDTPLFGWRLDLVWGARKTEHGVPIVRLEHPATHKRRSLPLFDVARCYRRGQSPEERLRSRPVRLDTAFEQGWVRRVDVLGRSIVIDRIDRFEEGATEVVELSFDDALTLNPDLEAVLETLQVHELTEYRRRLEAHQAAGGSWVLPGNSRLATGRLRLPLTGWRLATDAFDGAALGELRLAHPRATMRVSVSFREALETMRTVVPVEERLFGDPCEGPSGPGFLRAVDPDGCIITESPDDPVDTGERMSHSGWVRANPDLVPALLAWMPDLGVRATDPQLREALAELVEQDRLDVALQRDALYTPVPRTDSVLARRTAMEPLTRGARDLPVRWQDRDGNWWRWVSVDADGDFLFLSDEVAGAIPALPGPGVDRDLQLQLHGIPRGTLRLTPTQLTFAHPRLAREVAAWQRETGLLDVDGRPIHHGDRVSANLTRAGNAVVDAIARTREHLALSATLGEDPRRRRSLEKQRERLQANLADLRGGRAVRAWYDEAVGGPLGFGVAVGGVVRGAQRTGDDRIRITDGIQTLRLGGFRCVLVAGGDSWFEEPSGPLVARLLDDIEGRIATGIHESVSLDEVWERARDAILLASRTSARDKPYCSLVAYLQHHESGRAWVAWSGNSGVWRSRAGRLEPLTRATTLDGLVGLAREAGLTEPDAVQLVLLLTLRRVSRAQVDSVGTGDLVRAAERYVTPARRHAIRAAMGGAPEALDEEHERLLALLRTYDEAYDHQLRFEAVEDGRGMLFTRRLTLREGERLVLATDGFTRLLQRRPRPTEQALARPDPQRVVEWLVELTAGDDSADDLGVVVIDPEPSMPFQVSHVRRKGVVYRRSEDQDALVTGGVVPPLPDGSLPALSMQSKRLGRYYSEVDNLVRRRKIPTPDRDMAGFATGVARWALGREGARPPLRRAGEEVRGLHDVLEESDDDPLDETLITWWLLRRRGVRARYVRGFRVHHKGSRDDIRDTCWLHVPLPSGPHILDLDTRAPTLLPVSRAQHDASGGGWRTLLAGGAGTLEYIADRVTMIELPEPEESLDADPWLRLNTLSRVSLPQVAPAVAEVDDPAAPEETVEPPPSTDGWLDLDL